MLAAVQLTNTAYDTMSIIGQYYLHVKQGIYRPITNLYLGFSIRETGKRAKIIGFDFYSQPDYFGPRTNGSSLRVWWGIRRSVLITFINSAWFLGATTSVLNLIV